MIVGCIGATHAQTAVATGPVIYPAKGQSPRQQDQDRYQCHDWSRGQSGFDPTQPAPATSAAAQTAPPNQGSASKDATGSMARGALGGAAVAELGQHDPGRGAAIGVVGTSLIGRVKAQQALQAQQQQAAKSQQATRGPQQALYERAFGACMEARGYTVK